MAGREFTDQERRDIIRRYAAGETIKVIARMYSRTGAIHVRMKVSAVLHRAGFDVRRCSQPNAMPSEQEIWGRAPGETDASRVSDESLTAEIQSGWSEEERRRRAVCGPVEVDQPQEIESWQTVCGRAGG